MDEKLVWRWWLGWKPCSVSVHSAKRKQIVWGRDHVTDASRSGLDNLERE